MENSREETQASLTLSFIPPRIKEEELYNYFNKFTSSIQIQLSAFKRANMPKIGVLRASSTSQIEIILRKREHELISGERIKLERDHFNGDLAKTERDIFSRRVLLFGIKAKNRENLLKEFSENFTKIDYCHFENYENNRKLCYAMLAFLDQDAASEMLRLKKIEVGGRMISIKPFVSLEYFEVESSEGNWQRNFFSKKSGNFKYLKGADATGSYVKRGEDVGLGVDGKDPENSQKKIDEKLMKDGEFGDPLGDSSSPALRLQFDEKKNYGVFKKKKYRGLEVRFSRRAYCQEIRNVRLYHKMERVGLLFEKDKELCFPRRECVLRISRRLNCTHIASNLLIHSKE